MATALAAPNLPPSPPTPPIVLDAVRNTTEHIKGKATIAIMVSAIGSKLKLKCCPLERGKANI